MNALRDTAAAWLARGEPAVLVEVTEALGSAPREAGTRMLVSAAREMLRSVSTVCSTRIRCRSMRSNRC